MNRSMPGHPVHHQLPEFTQTQVHRISDAIQPSHPLSSPFHTAPNPSQHQSLFQGVNSSHEVAKVLPHVQGQGQKPGGPHARGAAAKRSYPTSEVRGSSREEQPHIQGAVAAWAPEGLEELFHIQGWEGRQ